MFKAIITILIWIMIAGGASATDYYVATDGNNGASGTISAPWDTITYAATQATAGDTVHIKGGNYGNENVVISNSGTSGNYITFEAYDGEAILVGTDFDVGTGIYANGKSYIKLQGFNISYYEYGIEIDYSSNITINDTLCFLNDGGFEIMHGTYYLIQNCTAYNNDMTGIELRGADYSIIENSHSYNIQSMPQYVDYGFALIWDSEHNIVRDCIAGKPLADGGRYTYHGYACRHDSSHNTFTNCSSYYTNTEHFKTSEDSDYNVFDNCTVNDLFFDSSVCGFFIKSSHNTVRNSLIQNTTDGIRIYWSTYESSATPLQGNVFENNVLVDNTNAIWFDNSGSTPPNNNTVKNCIIYDNGEGIHIESGITNSVLEYNNVYGNTDYYDGCSAGTGSISVDPLFADYSGNDFHLKSVYGRWTGTIWTTDAVTSPCIDTGNPDYDYSNEPAGNGGRINMGMYGNTEFASKSQSLDTIPPVITNVISSNINNSAIAISWTTDEPAMSQVEYGLDTSYGSNTNLYSNLVTSHSITITGLTNNTTYYYRVISQDVNDNLAISSNYNLITLSINTDQELIISDITAASGENYGLDTLDTGKLQYIDRSYTFSSVPSSYADLKYIRTANKDKASTDVTFLEFDVNQNVRVYVAHDDRISQKPSWLSSFTDTGDDLVGGGGTFSLYANNFSAGHISLGGNSGEGWSMYNVVLEPITDSTFVNNPPELEVMLEAIGDKIVDEGQALTFTLSATNADEDVLTFSASNLPDGAMFDQKTRTFQWTPDHAQSGIYTDVYFEVSDGILTDLENITITVNNVNREPTFTSGPANGSIFSETDSVQISIMANDPDNDPLNCIIKIDGIQVSTTPSYTWTTNDTKLGYHNIELSVSDGIVTVTEILTIYINTIDQELIITDITVASGENYGLDTLDTGKLQYIDRSYTFSSVPSSYADLKYIRTANKDKASTDVTFLEFDVNRDVMVYVAHDDRISQKPSWLASFTDTGDDLVGGGGTFSLYANNFSAGHISLGGNTGDGSSTSRSMYNVVLEPLNDSTFVNNPPDLEVVLEAIGDKIVDEGQALTFTLSATDANEDVLTFSASNLPDGAMFDQETRTFHWTPDHTRSGTYTDVYFEVSDGTLTDFENIMITVNNVNREPTFTSGPANGSIFSETDSIQISIMANDPDNDPLNYMIKIDGIQVSTTPSYTWTTEDTKLGYHNIELSVSDGTVTVTETLTICINNIDQELVISDITAASGENYGLDTLDTGKLQYIDRSYTFSSVPSLYADLKYIRTANEDPGSTGNTFLEFDVDRDVTVYVAHDDRISPKPSWLASFTDTGDDLVGGGGTFSLYANNYSAGHISLGGNTGDGSSTSRSMYNVVLEPLNDSTFVNNPPDLEVVLEAIGDKIVDEGQALTFTLSATDANEDVLTFSASNLPDGAMFDQETRTFHWTPDHTRSGTYTDVYFEVSDGTLTDFENIMITVNNVNREPTFTSGPANGSIFSETDSIQISIMANDPDNDPLNYMIKIDGIQVSTTPSYTWTTEDTKLGYHNIELSVSDGTVTVTETLTIYINNIDQELVISDITAASGENYVLDTLDTGKLQYIDRSYTFSSVPSSYADLKYIRTANEDPGSTGNTFLEFDVDRDVTVYVAHDDRISPKPSWLASFTDTGDDLVGGGGTFSLYANNYSAGHISLGGNTGDGSSSSRSMYNVVLKPLNDSTFVINPPELEAINVIVTPSSQIVTPGQTFNLNVKIDPLGKPIAGAQLDIAFDQSILNVNSITEGNLFKQNGASTFFSSGEINNSPGTVINIFGAVIGNANVSTPGTFIIINMTAINTYGTSGINLSNVIISDPNGAEVVLNVINGNVSIKDSLSKFPVIGDEKVVEGTTLTFSLLETDSNK